MIDIIIKKCGGVENLEKYGNLSTAKGILDLEKELKDILPKEETFIYQTSEDEILFKSESETRGIFHNIIYNKKEKTIKCNCEDCVYRSKKCKHIKKVVNKYQLIYLNNPQPL